MYFSVSFCCCCLVGFLQPSFENVSGQAVAKTFKTTFFFSLIRLGNRTKDKWNKRCTLIFQIFILINGIDRPRISKYWHKTVGDTKSYVKKLNMNRDTVKCVAVVSSIFFLLSSFSRVCADMVSYIVSGYLSGCYGILRWNDVIVIYHGDFWRFVIKWSWNYFIIMNDWRTRRKCFFFEENLMRNSLAAFWFLFRENSL